MTSKRSIPVLAVAGATVAALAVTGTAHAGQHHHHGPAKPAAKSFDRTATYPVFLNRPAGEDPATETVAEISDVSEDGRTLVYTDAAARRIGFLDISRADQPRGLGTLSLAQLGDAEDEPTSVAVVGRYVLVVVNTSAGYTDPSGRLDVIELRTRKRVRSIDLSGQPDSIAISADQRYAAIAIENERDEEATPPGAEEGDLPQAPAGFVQLVDLHGGGPHRWSLRTVPLTTPAAGRCRPWSRPGSSSPPTRSRSTSRSTGVTSWR
ncbi:hypothetical protein [Micromonospora tarapacensis]|uniref:hypothetical protein n=1 Tax=Micromonospora tarapacensis TaxID=2835305 RepID=UPI001E46E84F|nr:hypothetical protein [Micromonospora tarapacensis]